MSHILVEHRRLTLFAFAIGLVAAALLLAPPRPALAGAAFAAGQPAQQDLRDQAFLNLLSQGSTSHACSTTTNVLLAAPALPNCNNQFCKIDQDCAVCPFGPYFCNSRNRCQPF